VANPSIASLLNDYVNAFKRWIQGISELAKVEMSEQGKRAGIGAGLFAGAAFFGLFAFALITWALAYGLVALGLPVWAGFLIVAVLYLIIAGILALVGRRMVADLNGPERTIAAIKAGPGIPLGGQDQEPSAVL
jgi:hypothetical protein